MLTRFGMVRERARERERELPHQEISGTGVNRGADKHDSDGRETYE